MKYRKVIYPLILALFALQYCISVPIDTIPRSASKGAGLSLGYGRWAYSLHYSTCYGEVAEEHRVAAYQMDVAFRPRYGLDYHVILTQFNDVGRTVYPDTTPWQNSGIYTVAAISASPYVERSLADHTKVFLQIHWMVAYSKLYMGPEFDDDDEGQWGFLIDLTGGVTFGKNPQWSLGFGGLRMGNLSFYYRLPQNENWVLSAHAGLTLALTPYVALGIALTPRAH